MSDYRREQWEHVAEWPLTIAAFGFLAAYAWPILDTTLSGGWVEVAQLVAWVTWGLFALDYVVRLVLSDRRWHFVRRHLLDLAVIALPLLRPLRLLRLVMMLSVLHRYAATTLRGQVAVYVGGAITLVIAVAGLAVLDAERGAEGSNITSYPDALWWAMTTVTTVGYGDRYPVTGTGRFVATGLMLAGVVLLAVVTASLASWLLERVREVEEEFETATRRDVAALTLEVAALRQALEPGGSRQTE